VISPVAVLGLLLTVTQYGLVNAGTPLLTDKGQGKQHSSASSIPLNSLPDKDAAMLLERMEQALLTLNYQGTVVYSHDGIVESMQVIHKGGPDGEVERLIQLNGVPREVIRKGDVVTCYMSGSRSVLVGKRNLSGNLLSTLNTKFTKFADTYNFRVMGVGRVAGKVARIIDIQPKDKYRYGYKLWLKEEKALLLKSE